MSEWEDCLQDIKKNGFDKAHPISRLVWSCEVGNIDQHASVDLQAIMDELTALRKVAKAAKSTVIYTRDFVNAVYGVNGQLAHDEKERLVGNLAAALDELE